MEHPEADPEPPGGAPWDLTLADAPLVFLDAEMTGLDPDHDALVEVAFLRYQGARLVDRFATLLRPAVASRPEALAVHGLTDDVLAGAPALGDVAPRVAALLAGAVPVAHGAAMDVTFLTRGLTACGEDPAPLRHCLDTLTLARRALAQPGYTLQGLVRALGLPLRRFHRAAEDAAAVHDLFRRVAPEFAPESPRDLWEVRVGQRTVVRVRGAIARKLEALAASGATCALVLRTGGRAAVRLTGHIERWIAPHVWVQALDPRRTLRVLRADRILRIEPVPPGRAHPAR